MFVWLWLWIARALRRAKERGLDAGATERATLVAAIGGGLAMVFVAGQFVDYLKVEIQVWLLVLLAVMLQLKRVAATADCRRRGARREACAQIGCAALLFGAGHALKK